MRIERIKQKTDKKTERGRTTPGGTAKLSKGERNEKTKGMQARGFGGEARKNKFEDKEKGGGKTGRPIKPPIKKGEQRDRRLKMHCTREEKKIECSKEALKGGWEKEKLAMAFKGQKKERRKLLTWPYRGGTDQSPNSGWVGGGKKKVSRQKLGKRAKKNTKRGERVEASKVGVLKKKGSSHGSSVCWIRWARRRVEDRGGVKGGGDLAGV